jgi:hypothetical protein
VADGHGQAGVAGDALGFGELELWGHETQLSR